MRRAALMLAAAAIFVVGSPVMGVAEGCSTSVGAVGNLYVATGTCRTSPVRSDGSAQPHASSRSPYTRFEWRSACGDQLTATYTGQAQPCGTGMSCPPKATMYRLFGLTGHTWIPLGMHCATTTPTTPARPPQITPALVARAFKRVPLPALRSISQPAGTTLIYFDTIFYVHAGPLTRRLTLLGRQITLQISPTRYAWEFGDGTTTTTSTPGRPYPAKDIVHRYQHAHTRVAQRVTITWTARYRIGTGPAQPVPGTVTTTGPATTLRITQATPVLTGTGH